MARPVDRETVLFDGENEIERLDGVHILPAGTEVLTPSGAFIVRGVRLVFRAADAQVYLDIQRKE